LLDYDNVLEKQREVIYGEREKILKRDSIRDEIIEMIKDQVASVVNAHFIEDDLSDENKAEIERAVSNLLQRNVKLEGLENINKDTLIEKIQELAISIYEEKEARFTPDVMRQVEKYLLLRNIDSNWKDHLYAMDDLKEGISLRAYGQQDPLLEYQFESRSLFDAMLERIKEDTITMLFRVELSKEEPKEKQQQVTQKSKKRKMITDETKRAAEEVIEKIDSLLDETWLKEHESRIKELEEASTNPDFWKRHDSKETLKLLSMTKKEVQRYREVLKAKEDLVTVLELYSESAENFDSEVLDYVKKAKQLADEFEIERFLSEPYDDLNAFVSFASGAGGVDAQDWTEMLLKMYLRFFEKKGFEAKIIDETVGEEAGIKSATVYVKGDFAYGLLKGESGVHRLVRISPFDANRRRHTSFALVEVLPDLGEVSDIDIDEKDLKIDIFRASGHGGQNVQKVETAVRITHIPTGITVTCQDERSQAQNKAIAMKILKSKLLMLEQQKQEETIKDIRVNLNR